MFKLMEDKRNNHNKVNAGELRASSAQINFSTEDLRFLSKWCARSPDTKDNIVCHDVLLIHL